MLTAPTVSEVVHGKHTLNLYGLQNAAAAAPVSQSELRGIQELNISPSIDYEDVFHQGGGNDSLQYASKVKWEGELSMLGGVADTNLAALLGITLGAGGQYGMSLRSSHEAIGFIARKIYQKDNATLIGCLVIPDVKIGDMEWPGPIDMANVSIPIYSELSPYILDGAVPVYDVWTADGVDVDFTPSSTPVKIQEDLLAPNNELITIYDFFVKHFATGDRVGTIQTSGYTQTPGTPVLSFSTAPAAGKVGMLYAAAV